MLFARKQANYGNEMTKLPAGFPAGSAAFWGSGLRLIAVLQADGAVEDRVLRCRVLVVRAEVAQAHELIGFRSLGRGERTLDLAARENLEGIRVQALKEVLVRRVGIGIGEEVRIQAYLGVYGLVGLDPVDGGLDLAAVGGGHRRGRPGHIRKGPP